LNDNGVRDQEEAERVIKFEARDLGCYGKLRWQVFGYFTDHKKQLF